MYSTLTKSSLDNTIQNVYTGVQHCTPIKAKSSLRKVNVKGTLIIFVNHKARKRVVTAQKFCKEVRMTNKWVTEHERQ